MKPISNPEADAYSGVFDGWADETDVQPAGSGDEEDAPGSDGGLELALADLDGDADDEDDEDVIVIGDGEATSALASTDVSDTTADRDQRIANTEADVEHERVRDYLRTTGTAEAIADRLQDLAEEEVVSPARRGQVLDMRNVTRRFAGDTTMKDLYRRPEMEPNDDIAVCVSLDMSGSMGFDEKEAKAAVGAFLFAVQEHTNGVVAANAWHDRAKEAVVRLITAPREQFRWPHLDAVWPTGGTPTSAGVYEAGILLDQLHADEHLLIVVTDGTPTSTYTDKFGDEFESGVAETEAVVGEIRDRGHSVVGIGFGGANETNLEAMFGEDAGFEIELEELPERLTEAFEAHVTGGSLT